LHDEHGVGAVVANPPTYQSHQLIRAHTADQGPFPTAEEIAARLLCPALHPAMTKADNDRTTNAILQSLTALDGGER
jgi:perosamine synthetase